MMYLGLLFFCLLLVATTQLRWVWSRRKAKSAATWKELLERAKFVDLENVRQVGECYLHPGNEQFKRQPAEMWVLLGGLDGINRLFQNAGLMLELAVFAEQWRHPDAPLIAELIRRDGVRIKKLVFLLQCKMLFHCFSHTVGFDMQETAATYFLMRGRLMGLYQTCHVARLPGLTAAF